jgi:hypothetical protein
MIASKIDAVNLPVGKENLAFIFLKQCANVTVIVSERQAWKVRSQSRVRKSCRSVRNENLGSM